MIERNVLRLSMGVSLPILSALFVEQLPKTGVAEVPFAFQVEGQTLPPGTYSLKQANHNHGVCIQNEKADTGMKCMAAKGKFGRSQGARLVFSNDSGRYFLSEIWFEADGRGMILEGPKQTGDRRSVRVE